MEYPEEARACWLSVEAGCFKGASLGQKDDEIPSTRTHDNLLSNKFLKQALHVMLPELDLAILNKVQKHESNQILRLFLFGTSEKLDASTFSHNCKVFINHYKRRCWVAGSMASSYKSMTTSIGPLACST